MKTQNLPVILRGFAVWLIIIFAESLHGTARAILLEPLVGDFRARQIAVFTGALIILTISFLFVRWLRAINSRQLLAVGFLWLVLTVAFEILLGRFVMRLSWERIFSDYDISSGGLMPFGLLFLIFAPFIAAQLKEKFSRF